MGVFDFLQHRQDVLPGVPRANPRQSCRASGFPFTGTRKRCTPQALGFHHLGIRSYGGAQKSLGNINRGGGRIRLADSTAVGTPSKPTAQARTRWHQMA